MKYSEFTPYRTKLLAQRSVKPVRMDEFDLYQAMASFKPTTGEGKSLASAQDALKAWMPLMKMEDRPQDDFVVTRGIKEALRGLFPLLKAQGYGLWIPEDVYAGYRVIAEESALPFQTFTTFPDGSRPDGVGSTLENLTFLNKTGPKSAVVLLNPLMPLGQFLSNAQTQQLTEWLAESKDRLLILDAVYEPKAGFDPMTLSLLKTGQCLLLHSLSKTWISPGALGVALPPKAWVTPLKAMVSEVSPEDLPQISRCLQGAPGRPQQLEALYQKAWKSLASLLVKMHPAWKPPASGYMSWLPLNFETLLNRFNLLAAPASIFGAQSDAMSVVSCLNVVQDFEENVNILKSSV